MSDIRNILHIIDMELTGTSQNYSLENVRDEYLRRTGKILNENTIGFFEAFESYMKENRMLWANASYNIKKALITHLKAFETSRKCKLDLSTFNIDAWKLITAYFIEVVKCNNSTTNKYLKSLKQYLRFAGNKGLFKDITGISGYKLLQDVETFKIALTANEIDVLTGLDLAGTPRLDKVRDLFLLEVLTGQRFSDVSKVLDTKHYDGDCIRITQQKTGDTVFIPRHPQLKIHLSILLEKYPNGFPEISIQKFNEYLKEIGKLAEFDQKHQWTIMVGKNKIIKSDFRYNLMSSHTGRRTFCTLALKHIGPELIMRVTGHRTYEQFREYVKIASTDLETAFENFGK